MNADQNNQLDSYRAGLALLGKTTETNTLVGFAAKCGTFGNKVDEITALIIRQNAPTPGKREERDRVFEEMKDGVLALAGVVLSYADERGLHDLASSVRLRPSDFHLRLGEQIRVAREIVALAESVGEGLAVLGVTPASLAEVRAKIAAAEAVMTSPRETIAARRAATEQLEVAFRDAEAYLQRQVLPLLLPLKRTKPEFYRQVLATFQVIDRPGTRSAEPKEAGKDETVTPATTAAGTTTNTKLAA